MTSESRHRQVRQAIDRGDLKRQPCEVCGMKPEPHLYGGWTVVAHHDDHLRPLEVRWLCRQHHADYHREQGSYRNNGRNRGRRKGKVTLSDRQQEFLAYYETHLTMTEIADLMGVSTQRVYQHLERLRELKVIR